VIVLCKATQAIVQLYQVTFDEMMM